MVQLTDLLLQHNLHVKDQSPMLVIRGAKKVPPVVVRPEHCIVFWAHNHWCYFFRGPSSITYPTIGAFNKGTSFSQKLETTNHTFGQNYSKNVFFPMALDLSYDEHTGELVVYEIT